MQAIEFTAEIKENKITIPTKYSNHSGETVRIIMLVDASQKKQVSKTANSKKKLQFAAISVKTKGLKVDREKANVRKKLL